MICNKKNNFFKLLSSGTFLIGTVCAFVGIAFNKNFLNTPSFKDYEIFKGLISHVTLLFCCLYLYYEGYFKITGFNNFISVILQGSIFLVCGIYSNLVLVKQGFDDSNSMFLREAPFENLPFINIYTCVPIILIFYLVSFTIYEKKTLPKDDIWYNKIKNRREAE